ncbi:hypothetical protein, partial [Halorubrum sp. Atlit-26R]|uniref:hypothetical protein n=1 Tax=Halorubrum sp. Atlit-26R TaxID=2282128 RepID=UPI0013147014
EEYAIQIEADDSISWSITVEDQPIYTEDDVEDAEFPLEFSGNGENVFGPFNLDGFFQPRLRANVDMDLVFASQEGETIQTVSAEYDEIEEMAESFVNLDTVNVSEVCWIWCSLSSLFTNIALENDQGVYYDVQIAEPDNN